MVDLKRQKDGLKVMSWRWVVVAVLGRRLQRRAGLRVRHSVMWECTVRTAECLPAIPWGSQPRLLSNPSVEPQPVIIQKHRHTQEFTHPHMHHEPPRMHQCEACWRTGPKRGKSLGLVIKHVLRNVLITTIYIHNTHCAHVQPTENPLLCVGRVDTVSQMTPLLLKCPVLLPSR